MKIGGQLSGHAERFLPEIFGWMGCTKIAYSDIGFHLTFEQKKKTNEQPPATRPSYQKTPSTLQDLKTDQRKVY